MLGMIARIIDAARAYAVSLAVLMGGAGVTGCAVWPDINPATEQAHAVDPTTPAPERLGAIGRAAVGSVDVSDGIGDVAGFAKAIPPAAPFASMAEAFTAGYSAAMRSEMRAISGEGKDRDEGRWLVAMLGAAISGAGTVLFGRSTARRDLLTPPPAGGK